MNYTALRTTLGIIVVFIFTLWTQKALFVWTVLVGWTTNQLSTYIYCSI